MWVPTLIVLIALAPTLANAQTSTYHLHFEGFPNSEMRTDGPDRGVVFFTTPDLANSAPADYPFMWFRTLAGVPGLGGTIPTGSTFTFALWMNKTANVGAFLPKAKLMVETPAHVLTTLCAATGAVALTTTSVKYTVGCTTTSPVAMSIADRFQLEVTAAMTASAGGTSVKVQLGVEGALNANYDSTITAPLPQPAVISSLTPASGPTGNPVHITGSLFGAVKGTSTVTFNGVTATPTAWSDIGIDVSTPPTATTGPVVVTVRGAPSNGATFTVTPGPSLTSLTPTSALPGDAVTITGTNFLSAQGPNTVTFNGLAATPTTWSDTSITVPAPQAVTTGPVMVTVYGHASNTLAFTLSPPGLTSLTPNTAAIGDSITIAGQNFLSPQGTSTVTFNGVTATPTSWSNTSVAVPAPTGATTGSVVMTVRGQASNALTFTVVTTGTLSGTITRTSGGSALPGATVQAVLTGTIVATASSGADGSYAFPTLQPGTYDLRVLATGYSSEVRSGTAVTINVTTTVNVAMSQPGGISGRVTQADGTTPLVGAAVTLFLNGLEKGSASTNASGDYAVTGLHPGSYTVRAANVGSRTHEQGALVSENVTTTANISLDGAPVGPVTYVYDELGRLISVVDPSGDAATYTYDAVGNILSIGRIGAGMVAITEFTPNGAAVGSTVTISGTGFSATGGENTVTFNGTSAAVVSATTTQIVTTVPAGAASGPIGVTTPAGAATSSTAFIVTGSTGAPSISSFTPAVAAAGVALTIAGTNFDPAAGNDLVTVNETFASLSTVTTASIATTVPASATSGHLRVTTAFGTAASTNDLYIPPPPYTAADVVFMNRMGYGDAAALAVPVNTAGKIALVLFDAVAGHRLAFKLSSVTIGLGVVTILGPHGAPVAAVTFFSGSTFVDPKLLASTGTYTIMVDPTGTATGSATLTLYDVPADVPVSITPGGDPVIVQVPSLGQRVIASFTATDLQRVSLNLTNGTIGGCTTVIIKKPDTSTVASNTCVQSSGAFIDLQTLTPAGTYTITVDPGETNSGYLTLTLFNVPPDASGSVSVNGTAFPVTTSTPGQNGAVTFSGSSGQLATVKVEANALTPNNCVTVKLLRQSGAELVSSLNCGSSFNLTQQTLPATETYTIVIDPNGTNAGTLNVKVTNP
jgi:YD repeat-containing protein